MLYSIKCQNSQPPRFTVTKTVCIIKIYSGLSGACNLSEVSCNILIFSVILLIVKSINLLLKNTQTKQLLFVESLFVSVFNSETLHNFMLGKLPAIYRNNKTVVTPLWLYVKKNNKLCCIATKSSGNNTRMDNDVLQNFRWLYFPNMTKLPGISYHGRKTKEKH